MKAHQKSLFQHVSETRHQLREKSVISSRLWKVYTELTWLHDMYMLVQDDESLKDHVQKLTLNWMGEDEENFTCLKLLRMKAFGTI